MLIADDPNDILYISGGTGVNVTASGTGTGSTVDQVLIENSAPNIVQNVFQTIQVDGAATTTANTATDTLTIQGGTDITTSIVGDVITISYTGSGGGGGGGQHTGAGGRGQAGGIRIVDSKEELTEVVKNLLGTNLVTYQTDGKGSIEVSGPGLRNYKNIADNPPDFKITSGGNWNNTYTQKFGTYDGKVITIKLTVANANGVTDPNFGPDPGGIAVRIYDKNGKTHWSTKDIFDSYSGGARAEGEVVLVRNDQKTVTLRSGVDYGVRMTTTCNTNMPGAEMVENGTKLLYEDLGMSGDYNDLIVTCSKGKFRSKDGTDDTGKFGHNGKMVDQILWSTPKIEAGGGLSGGGDNMQFTFNAQDGTHSFTITAKEIQKSTQLSKSVKVNTVYNVKAAIKGDIELLKLAVLQDPLVSSVCSSEEVWQMVDEMLVAQAQWLPQYQSKINSIKKNLKKIKNYKYNKSIKGLTKKTKRNQQKRSVLVEKEAFNL